MTGPKKREGPNFEGSLKKLEEIVRRLEDEEVDLEESLRLFAEGKALAKACEGQLRQAENRVRQIMEDSEGNLAEAPLAEPPAERPEAAEPSAPAKAAKDDLPF